jgi:hypothetical protein
MDPYAPDPRPDSERELLSFLGWALRGIGILAAAIGAFALVRWTFQTLPPLFLAFVAAIACVLYLLRRFAFTYRFLAVFVVVGSFGISLGWFRGSVPLSGLLVVLLLVLVFRFLKWLGRPIRHRGRRFSDFPSFLGPWAEAMDRRATIHVEPDARRAPRLRFRLAGRGIEKRLKVRLPTRRETSDPLLAQIESLIGLFDGPVVRSRRRSVELSLPAQAPYTGSLASRAAEAAFRSFGCSDESTFTIYAERGALFMDPYHELRSAERAATLFSGWIGRYFEARAEHLRKTLPRQGRRRSAARES